MKIQIQNEEIELLPQKAFYWPKEKLLGFSDVHIGKAESFQKIGIPIPSESRNEDLTRIDFLIHQYQPKRVVILGDLIHDQDSWTPELLADLKIFLEQHSEIEWNLILGNHERGSLPYLTQLPFRLSVENLEIPPFLLTHGHLSPKPGFFQIEGHLHPVLTLSDGPLRMRFPCFVMDSARLLLPSFGVLTGGAEVPPEKSQRRFAVTPSEVFEVASSARRS